jgi:3-dehydrosphinganine reductase
MSPFKDKLVFITGGSSGIGKEAASMLAASGASVAIFGRDPARLESARAEIESRKLSYGCVIAAMGMDVADHEDVEVKIASAVRESGVPDILINSAGIGHADYFGDITYEKFDEVIRTNLYGTRNTVASLVPHMKKNGGHIVNVSSMLGLIGLFGYSAYCSSKFALIGFSECLRSELKRYGIRVSVFCPPEVDTPMTDYMATSSPFETRALVKMNGLMSSERAARLLLKGIEKKRFLIIPGALSKLAYVNKILNPPLTRLVLDAVVSTAGRMKRAR